MSAVRELDRPTSLVKQVEANPVMVLLDEKKFDEFYSEIEHEVKAFKPDLSTVTSRKEISSLAYKVTRTKTAIDAAGKKLNEEAREKINAVDASRRTIRGRLDALADRVRKPLTEWEAAEANRVDYCKRIIQHIKNAGNGTIDGEAYPFAILLRELEEKVVIDDTFGEFKSEAEGAREAALANLRRAMEHESQLAAERAELEKLRAEKAERDRVEAERIAAEQAKREREEAEKREAERQAAAKEAERKRVAEAEERARRQAKEAAEQEKREAEQRHAAELQRIEDERAAERRKAEQEAAAKAATEKAERDAEKARQDDRDHRSKILGAAKEAVIDAGGISEPKANLIVSAIAAGSIPNVTIRY